MIGACSGLKSLSIMIKVKSPQKNGKKESKKERKKRSRENSNYRGIGKGVASPRRASQATSLLCARAFTLESTFLLGWLAFRITTPLLASSAGRKSKR